MKISVIIPVLNEEQQLPETLARLTGCHEIIVVDGGSTDASRSIAAKLHCHVVDSPPGRARQLNLGARLATGDILFFLHGDTLVPAAFTTHITQLLQNPEVSLGAFSLGIPEPTLAMRLVVAGANLRSRFLKLPYGDQGLFLTQKFFKQLDGFKELAIMEDFDLVQRAGRLGKIVTLAPKVTTSKRRWQNLGVWQTTLTNQLVVLGYLCGMSPERLARIYRRGKGLRDRDKKSPTIVR